MLVYHVVDRSLSLALCYANATGIATTVTVLILSSIVQSIRRNEERPPALKLRRCQLILSGLIVGLSIVHAVLLGRHVNFSDKADRGLVSVLFTILSWVILSIALFERGSHGGLPQHLAWACSLLYHVVELAIIVHFSKRGPNRPDWIDIAVLVARITATVVLLVSAAVLRCRPGKQEVALSEEETQPLLDPEANGAPDKASTAAKDDDATKGEDEKKDDDDEDDPDAEERKELRKRPLRQYIASFAIFMPHIRPKDSQHWLYIGVITVCIAIRRAMNVLVPLTTGALVNSLQGAETVPWKPLLLYLALYTLNSAGIVSTTKSLATIRFESKVKQSLNLFCYTHIMNLSADFHDSKASQRVNRIMDRGEVVSRFFSMFWFDILPRISDLAISLGVIAWLFGGYLCFIVATTIVFFAYANAKFIGQKTTIRRAYVDAWSDQWHHMWETMHSWATVSHFNQLNHERDVSKEKTRDMFKKGIHMYDYDAIAEFVRQAIICTGFVTATIVAINQIIYSRRGVGDFVMLVTYWSQVMAPVTGLISLINRCSEQLVDAERLMLLLEKTPNIKDTDRSKEIDFQGGTVEFDHVTFSYDGERTVSEDVSFRVEAGSTVAIVGETGGGKSTLLKLLFRFYDPTKGCIRIDGQDLRDIQASSFRELIGFVPQDPAMFQRSVFDNVRYAKLTATDDEVIEACKGAVLHDKIMTFAKGYKQKVGERGARLSGGEQQRLAIARAILKKPKMLLLDEATSSVDSVTETKIHECLKELCKGRTTFIIAHRLSTILHADLILVMKNGKLVEQGPHRELMKRDGAYKELWTAQLKLQSENPDADKSDNNNDDDETNAGDATGDVAVDNVNDDNSTTSQPQPQPRPGNENEDQSQNQSQPQHEDQSQPDPSSSTSTSSSSSTLLSTADILQVTNTLQAGNATDTTTTGSTRTKSKSKKKRSSQP